MRECLFIIFPQGKIPEWVIQLHGQFLNIMSQFFIIGIDNAHVVANRVMAVWPSCEVNQQVGDSSQAMVRQSARTRRPSASVFPISTVVPERDVRISLGDRRGQKQNFLRKE